MHIAIIGAGFGGLSAAYYAAQKGWDVTLIEKASYLGGLGAGMNAHVEETPPWEWELEQFYHHWFTNDDSVFSLANDMGVADKMIIKRPISATWRNGKSQQLDSPVALLKYSELSLLDRIRTGVALAELKYAYTMESSKKLEDVTAHEWLQQKMGTRAYETLWEPLLKGKFKDYYQEINMRWFWARIYKRTPQLAYYQGGFAQFAQDIAKKIEERGGRILLNTALTAIEKKDDTFTITYNEGEILTADAVVVTTPPIALPHFVKDLPEEYVQKLKKHDGIGAFTLVLGLKHPLMMDTYWLNVNEEKWPFLAVVEHTNFMDKSHYNNEHVVYIGDYLPADHPNMSLTKEELIAKFTPYLKEINPLFSSESIARSYLFKAPYAQPIVRKGHEQNILPFETPIEGLYLATMSQVYPWDRGTNYAIEMGKQVVEKI